MMKIQELLKKEGEFIFDVNDWGSCQYSGALSMYRAYFKIRESHDQENILGYLKYNFGYDISFISIRDEESARDKYFESLNKRFGWGLESIDDDPDKSKLLKSSTYDYNIFKSIRRIKSAEDMFYAGRNFASDLWSTAPIVAKSYFENLVMKETDNSTGLEEGPSGNICAQISNVETGLCCALLKDYGLIKNEKSFGGFDT